MIKNFSVPQILSQRLIRLWRKNMVPAQILGEARSSRDLSGAPTRFAGAKARRVFFSGFFGGFYRRTRKYISLSALTFFLFLSRVSECLSPLSSKPE